MFSPLFRGLETPVGTIPPWIFWLILGGIALLIIVWALNPASLLALVVMLKELKPKKVKWPKKKVKLPKLSKKFKLRVRK